MLKVYNDLLIAADSGQVSALCLLDLTATFDTVDHDLLILRLERQFGLRSVVLQWFRSYLCDRSFRVVISSGASLFGSLGLLCTPGVSSWSAHVHYVLWTLLSGINVD